ncbi:hypothetical protein ACH5A2_02725 [Streptomyces collinus]|uniref:hypothetical protein n=1 Tax=Streptomyces collinus TaxID=42684 RepID=UPI0037B202F9
MRWCPTGRYTHDEAGHVTSVTDPLGHTTTIVCDRAGLPPACSVSCFQVFRGSQ